ncbi:hypothetical protein CEXT_461911 [Caerostris extrusa]|uniref:Uncharacterized protein n=1 Tax=Caerostris extrusa TaxID=172846 RepID=A0AAV4VRC6_CAEEX|nr:hypothetical protein CEXT_461911 [Caerostris extrusa]
MVHDFSDHIQLWLNLGSSFAIIRCIIQAKLFDQNVKPSLYTLWQGREDPAEGATRWQEASDGTDKSLVQMFYALFETKRPDVTPTHSERPAVLRMRGGLAQAAETKLTETPTISKILTFLFSSSVKKYMNLSLFSPELVILS